MKLKRADVDCLVLEACLDAQPSANGWRRTNCPLCVYYGEPSEDTKQSFGVHESGAWHCFRCGAVGFSGSASEAKHRLGKSDMMIGPLPIDFSLGRMAPIPGLSEAE